MALFKVSKGLKANLPSAKTEGYCWYTTDDSLFYIDYKDENGTLQRKALNAKDAETLTGASLSTILNSSDVEIPTSKAVLNALNAKLDKADAGSDWNQNDNTKPDYIKNRPFYTGDPVETVMLPETTITIVSGGENLISSSLSYSFELGKTYVITFDGVDTEYTAYEVQGLVLVGDNFSSVAGGSGYVVMANNGSIVLNTMDSSLDGSHTIAIKIYSQEIVKVDEKYLPESAFTDAEWSKISNKIVDYKQQSLSLSVSGEEIPMRTGNSYSNNKINDNLKFENGKAYEINGSITLHNPVGNNESVLNINGHYICSNGEIVFGSCYDIHYKKDIQVSLYSSDSVIYQGMLCISSAINVNNTSFTFDINITVTGEAKQLPDICIGENIQRVGDDIILSSSTAGSTKKFKITVDDDYNVSATNTSDSVSKTLATTEYVDNKFSTKTASVTLAADSWTGTESPYSQVVTIDGVTANSKVDLNPTGEQLNSIATNRTILNTANDNGTVTVYAVGNKPTEDYTMQVTITEV